MAFSEFVCYDSLDQNLLSELKYMIVDLHLKKKVQTPAMTIMVANDETMIILMFAFDSVFVCIVPFDDFSIPEVFAPPEPASLTFSEPSLISIDLIPG